MSSKNYVSSWLDHPRSAPRQENPHAVVNLPNRSQWMKDAACDRSGVQEDAWFTHGADPDTMATIRVCQRCPVRTECLEFALAEDLHGVWGGTTRAHRRFLQEKRGDR